MNKTEGNSLRADMQPFVMDELVAIVMESKHLSLQDALAYIYSTNVYKLMDDDEAKMWYISSRGLYDLIEEEKADKHITLPSAEVRLFCMFCIENWRLKHNVSGAEALNIFNRYEIFDFLSDTFIGLHTQDPDYIITAVDEYLAQKGLAL